MYKLIEIIGNIIFCCGNIAGRLGILSVKISNIKLIKGEILTKLISIVLIYLLFCVQVSYARSVSFSGRSMSRSYSFSKSSYSPSRSSFSAKPNIPRTNYIPKSNYNTYSKAFSSSRTYTYAGTSLLTYLWISELMKKNPGKTIVINKTQENLQYYIEKNYCFWKAIK